MNKKVWKEMVSIAGPAIVESLFMIFIGMIDTKMVAGMGRRAVSAVSLTNQPKLFFFTIYFALATCLTICVSNSYGKKDSAEASK
jgi:Na+-driven multidrug efflux pump